EMTRLSKQYDDVAFLSWAKPTTGTPKHINDAVINAISEGLTSGYSQSEGLPELREEIVKKLKRDNNVKANTSQIIATVGAIEGLAASVMAVIDPGDEVILPTPTYSTHITQVKLASGKPILVPLIEDDDFALDINAIKIAITNKTKAILFCTPNNPTGTVFPEKTLRELAKIALEHNITLIVDEAYEYFTYDDNKHFSIASIPELRKHVITNYTFTKTYAMTGWRIGYVHANEEMLEQINKVHIPFSICTTVASQYAAIAALKGSQDCIEEFKSHYLNARNLMCERLDKLNSIFEYSKPQGAYLMFPKILIDQGKGSIAFSKDLLKNVKVSTTPGVAFGPTGEGHIRLSFCVPEDMINVAFDRMEKHFG
ncbi:MAG: aminotransferase class I/II-fold pyridoxal phosphate-dependent enzyme, partial [Candidatus Marinimicrobia bacterium]|nr:aminotransferase class I/II-fold pyridoxal phosphate-dependent enzyme [Candidatus Neomarinimicrobiota bacterium]